jgi:hypothetical protein
MKLMQTVHNHLNGSHFSEKRSGKESTWYSGQRAPTLLAPESDEGDDDKNDDL